MTEYPKRKKSAAERLAGVRPESDFYKTPTPADVNRAPGEKPNFDGNLNRSAGSTSLSGPPVASSAGKTVPNRGGTVLGMPVNSFAQMAGGLAQAISPDTAEGRAGGFISRFASQKIAREDKVADKKSERDFRISELEDIQSEARGAAVTQEERRVARAKELEKNTEARDKRERDRGADARGLVKDINNLKLEKLRNPDAKEYTSDDGTITGLNPDGTVAYTTAPGVGKTSSSGDKDLSLSGQMNLEKDIAQNTYSSMGYGYDKDRGGWFDSAGVQMSAEDMKVARNRIQNDLTDMTALVNGGATLGSAWQTVNRNRTLEYQKSIMDAYNKVSTGGLDISKVNPKIQGAVNSLIKRDAAIEKEKLTKRKSELDRANTEEEKKQTSKTRSLYSTGPTAKKIGEGISRNSQKIFESVAPAMESLDKKLNRIPLLQRFNERNRIGR